MSNLSVLLHSIAQSSCTEGDVRLVGGKTDKEGDVQICWQGVWGYVCSEYFSWYYYSSWSSEEARIVCQKLNYSSREYVLQHWNYSHISFRIIASNH